MGDSIVLELQRMAAGSQTSIAELMRKALIVATKLKIEDFKKWINAELNGYNAEGAQVPAYRVINAEVKAFSPHRGLFTCQFISPADARRAQRAAITNPIAELEDAIGKENDHVVMDFSPEALHELQRYMDDYNRVIPRKYIAKNYLTGIVDRVRTTILEWSLKLEEEGIVGDGMSFSDDEKKKAAEARGIHIKNFQGVLGNVTTHNFQVGDYSSIHDQLKEAGVPQDQRYELETILDDLKKAKPNDKPTVTQRGMDWVGRNAKTLGAVGTVIAGWFGH